jgi:hypothetical protein
MPLFMLPAIFPKPLSWQPLLFHIILFVQDKSQDLSLRQSFYPNLSIYKITGTYKVEWSHYFTNLYFVDIIKGFQTPLRKLSKRRC